MTREEENIEGMKRNIEAQLAEYEQAMDNARRWYLEWKARQPKGFRSVIKQEQR